MNTRTLKSSFQNTKRHSKRSRSPKRVSTKKNDQTFVTFDPNTISFTISTKQSIHQRNMFINKKLSPSLNPIKNANEHECTKSICK
jgi:hypothetical protein